MCDVNGTKKNTELAIIRSMASCCIRVVHVVMQLLQAQMILTVDCKATLTDEVSDKYWDLLVCSVL